MYKVDLRSNRLCVLAYMHIRIYAHCIAVNVFACRIHVYTVHYLRLIDDVYGVKIYTVRAIIWL